MRFSFGGERGWVGNSLILLNLNLNLVSAFLRVKISAIDIEEREDGECG